MKPPRSIWLWAPVILALLMLAVLVIPYRFWTRAPSDAVYHGLDPNLIKIDERGIAQTPGVIEAANDSLRVVAVPRSNPRVRLGSTPKDFNVSMDISIIQNDPGTNPLSIDVWQWRNDARYSLVFGSPPNNYIMARAVQGEKVIREEILSPYTLGQTYRVRMVIDREREAVRTTFEEIGNPPAGGNWVVLTDAVSRGQRYAELVSYMVPVEVDGRYEFGATVKLANGYGNFKLGIFWFDKNRHLISWSPPVGWHSPGDLHGWIRRQFVATAPKGAAFATIVASAEDSTYFMTDFFLRRVTNTRVNLLSNGQFRNGLDGWTLVEPGIGVSASKPAVGFPSYGRLSASIDATVLPDLFIARRELVWSLQAASPLGTAIAEVQNYSIEVPPQTWRGSSLWGVRVDDPIAARLVWILFALGCLLAVVVIGRGVLRVLLGLFRRQNRGADPLATVSFVASPFTIIAGVVILGCLVFNAFLFHLGYHLIDFNAAKIWSYVGVRYGVAELYSLTALVTTGEPWTGAALKHADFPYGPTMAYLFAIIGWIYRLFLAGPKGLNVEGVELSLLLKSINMLFVLATAIVIFLIVRTLRVRTKVAVLSAMFFLLNPAVWFVVSIWGETHAMSVFFLLLAILFAQKRQPAWTWITLALTVLSRPQLWLPGFLLALVCFRRFSAKENVQGLAWGVILVFLLLLPFNLRFGPSFLLNWIIGVVDVQTPAQNVAGFDIVASLGAYNLWPLVSPFTLGASGYARMWFPSVVTLVGTWNYSLVSTVLTLVIETLIMACMFVSPRVARSNGGYIPAMAFSLLTVLLFRTGVSNHHFILALALVIATKDRIDNRAYYAAVAVLTLTTFVSVAGDFIYHIQWEGIGNVWIPALYPGNHALMRFLLSVYQTDWMITLGALGNLAVTLWLGWEAIRPFRTIERLRHQELVPIHSDPYTGTYTL